MIILAGFLYRFLMFWLKIVACIFFVIILQVQYGGRTFEQWIEYGIKRSSFVTKLNGLVLSDVNKMNKKFPKLERVIQNEIIKNEQSVIEFHSKLLKKTEKEFNTFDSFLCDPSNSNEENPDFCPK